MFLRHAQAMEITMNEKENSTEEKSNKLKILQEELLKQSQFFDDHGPVILGVRDQPPRFYESKPKFPEGEV